METIAIEWREGIGTDPALLGEAALVLVPDAVAATSLTTNLSLVFGAASGEHRPVQHRDRRGGQDAIGAKYVFMASMDVAPEKEALFNEVYDREHVPNLLAVPGVLAVTRVRGESFAMSIGGERRDMPAASPRYTAIYELESPDVLASDAWARAVEAGRWPGEVRPFTTNRRHVLARVL